MMQFIKESKNILEKYNTGYFDGFRELNKSLSGYTYWDYGRISK